VEDLEPAVYRYLPLEHALVASQSGDRRLPLSRAVTSREFIRDAAAIIAITAVQARTRVRYGSDARRYVLMEAGHVGQSICLQTVSLGLGAITLGAFHAGDVRKVLALPGGERAEYLIAVGASHR
jgi:SagB-type dehydrogenase family enzyme